MADQQAVFGLRSKSINFACCAVTTSALYIYHKFLFEIDQHILFRSQKEFYQARLEYFLPSFLKHLHGLHEKF
jgi:hypothetical protein